MGTIIEGISKVSWGPLPMYWVSNVLPQMQCSNVLLESGVLQLLDLVELHMVYQEPILRGAAHHNILLFVISKLESITKPVLESFLFTFWKNKVFFVNTLSWGSVQMFLSDMYGKGADGLVEETLVELNNLKKAVSTPLHILIKLVQKALLPFLIFSSCEPLNFPTCIEQLHGLLFSDIGATNRPYAAERVNLNLEESARFRMVFLKSLMELLMVPERRNGRDFLKYLETDQMNNCQLKMVANLLLTNDSLESILTSLSILKLSNDVQDIGIATVYCDVLSGFYSLDPDKARDTMTVNLKEIFNVNASSVSRTISLKVCLAILKNFPDLIVPVVGDIVSNIPIQLAFDHTVTNRETQKISGGYTYEFTNNQIELIKLCILKNPAAFPLERKESLLIYLEETLESCGRECAGPAIDLANLLDIPALSLIKQTERVLVDMRKNDMFWSTLQKSLDLIFSNLKYNPADMLVILNETARDSSTPGIMGSLIHALNHQFQSGLLSVHDLQFMYEGVIPILTRGVVFGPTFRRDQKIVTDTNQIVSEQGHIFSINRVEGSDHELCQTVRIRSTDILLSLIHQNPSSTRNILDAFFKSAVYLQHEVSKGRLRHFENSEIHKLRNRKMQVLLLVCSVVGSHPQIGMFSFINSTLFGQISGVYILV